MSLPNEKGSNSKFSLQGDKTRPLRYYCSNNANRADGYSNCPEPLVAKARCANLRNQSSLWRHEKPPYTKQEIEQMREFLKRHSWGSYIRMFYNEEPRTRDTFTYRH